MPTIGVAVAVPEPWGPELQDYRRALGDTQALGIPTHITLLPPTEVSDEVLCTVAEHLRRAAEQVGPFRVRLRGTGTFRPVSPVVFVAVAEGIGGCEQLTEAIRTGPLAVDLSFPYHPHVTVAHQLADEVLDRAFDELATFECAFEVAEIHLYVHADDSGWNPAHSFRLG